MFSIVKRQQFRRYYQPTRIMLGLVPATEARSLNIITLCFTASCSYKPPMIVFAVQEATLSYELFKKASQCVLAVPGEELAEQTLFCGTRSGRDTDKVSECGFTLTKSKKVNVPRLAEAIANLELTIENRIFTGDHLTVVGRVDCFAVNERVGQQNLLSVGPEHDGYRVLASKGIHRIGVVDQR